MVIHLLGQHFVIGTKSLGYIRENFIFCFLLKTCRKYLVVIYKQCSTLGDNKI